MSSRFIFFIIVHIAALAYFLEVLRRLYQRFREYPLDDSPETLPFGFIKLKYVVIVYVLFYIIWVAVSLWLYFGVFAFQADGAPASPANTILNL